MIERPAAAGAAVHNSANVFVMRYVKVAMLICSLMSCGRLPSGQADLRGVCLDLSTDLPPYPFDPWLFEPPPLVLLTDVEEADGGRYVLEEVPLSLPATHPISWWTMKGPDSVELTWSDGAQGVRVMLPSHGDTLRGRAIELDHMLHEDSGTMGPAVGVVIPCDADVPPQHRRVRPALSVSFADGRILRIGTPISDDWFADTVRPYGMLVPGETTGTFAGARTVHVETSQGRIGHFALTYADSTHYGPVLEALAQLLGEPGPILGGFGWRDRELTVRFYGPVDESKGFVVTIVER